MKKLDKCMYIEQNETSFPCCCNVCSRLDQIDIPHFYTLLLTDIYTFLFDMKFYCDDVTLKKLVYNIFKLNIKSKTNDEIKLCIIKLCLAGNMIDPIICLNVCFEMIKSNNNAILYKKVLKLIENKISFTL